MIQDTQSVCQIINQIHSIQNKVLEQNDSNGMVRKFERLHKSFEAFNMFIHNPIGEAYNATRMDCEATISGSGTENLQIVEVIKPIIYLKENGRNEIIQRGIVIVEAK